MYIPASDRNRRRGFTIAEMMVVVAILAILAGLAIPSLLSARRLLDMKALDNCAQDIFLTAQNRLTAQKSSGTVAKLSDDGVSEDRKVTGVPALANYRAFFLTQDTIGDLLPRETLESQLLSNYFYVIYDEDSGSVLAVLYSESPFNYQEGYNAVGLDARTRIQKDLWVGWYNGTPAGSESIVQLDAPAITIRNGEKLIAEITVTTPSTTAAPLSSIDLKVSIDGVSLPVGDPVPVGALSQKYTVILDSLAPGESRFQALNTGVAPGGDFTLRAWSTCASSSVQDSAYNYATDNSLFASGSGNGTAYIACGRHLQNLDQGSGVTPQITQAVQTANLRFDDTGSEDSWYACYTQQGVAYTPVTNPNLASYTGYDASRLTQTTITGLSASGVQSAGLFATFSGVELSDIWLVNPKFQAAKHAGGLAGVADRNLTIENCRVYHAYSDSTVQAQLGSYTNNQITAPCAGGLVGQASGSLTIKNSLAATLLRGSTLAGGLAGSVGGSLNITGSYADCYLSGYQTGGLAGQAGQVSRVESCYTAGFVTGSTISAGLVCGPGRVQDSYCAISYLSVGDVYPLVTAGSAQTAYYLQTATTANSIGVGLSGNALKGLSLYGQFAPATGSTTRPYNLMEGMALSVYSFPRLAQLPHYGDWRSEFESGALVYYESYGDGSYGFYGASLGRLQDGKTVLSDGYAVAFRQDEPARSVSVVYQGNSYNLNLSSLPTVTDVTEEGGVTYCLAPLPDAVVNTTTASPDFYQTITVSVDGSPSVYYFNPHFAKTAVAQAEGETAAPEAPSPISIRTSRHLYALSAFPKEYAAAQWAFAQELKLNYSTYQWSKTGFTAGVIQTAPVQAPIGPDTATPFSGTYNGGGQTISGVSISGSGRYLGLFGVNTGTIRGVIYSSDGSYVRPAAGISGRSATLYVGGLTGRNEGAIRDSAAAGLALSASNTGNSTVYMGGFVGDNLGLIRQCTAACSSIRVASTRANAYAATFAGRSSGSITRSSSQGAAHVAKDTSGTVAAAGFVCENTGSVSYSYCAAGLYADGGAHEAAFCWSTETQVTGCRYLTDGSYTFGGQTFGLTYPDGSGAVGLKQLDLAQAAILGMSPADDSTRLDNDGDGTMDEIDDKTSYPYPLVLDRHYGPWLRRLDLGDLGVCYWEREEKTAQDGAVSEAYHFYAVGLDDPGTTGQSTKITSTLCGYHDDGGVITDYGYAYFAKNSLTSPVKLSSTSLTIPSQNSAVSETLNHQMEEKYTFVAYSTYTADTGAVGLHPSGSNVNGLWTLSQNGRTYPFTISPFFAASIQYNNDSASAYPGKAESSPYGVRSIQQLQFINWNHAEKNCTTNSQDKVGKYPYLGYDDHVTEDKISTRTRGYYYLQGHDLNGGEVERYTPIGSMTNWFAGHYNGNDYVIQDLSIRSSARLVGLFGLIHGGTVNNVILHSEQGAVAESTYGSGNYSGLGVLAGAALNDKSTVNNCAVSGYTVIRSGSINAYTSVGGLFGMCNMTLSGCTAVTNIQVSTSASSNMVHVGGLVGSAKCTISQCYAGGSLSYTGASTTKLYLGGITGYEDSPSTNHGGLGTALILENCYSYVQTPKKGAAAYAIGPGTVNNCYYLNEAVASGVNANKATAMDHQQFADGTLLTRLNVGISSSAHKFAPVTTRYADGTAIDGKYTFPIREDLDGRNYPFPAILTQDSDQVEGGTARLHYGDWPEKGLLGQGLVEVDLIAHRADGSPDSTAAIQLAPTGLSGGGSYSIAQEADSQIATASLSSGGVLTVTGVSPGYTTVTAAYTVGGSVYTLDIEIAVTATVDVAISPAAATLLSGGLQDFTAHAADKYGNPLDGERLSWTGVQSNAPAAADVLTSGDREDGGFAFTAQGLGGGGDVTDAIFTATAAYTAQSGTVYSGVGRAGVSVVPVIITAQNLELSLTGGAPVPYGPDRISVTIQGQQAEQVSITGVRLANAELATAQRNEETGVVAFTPLALGQTQATFDLSYMYNGSVYQGSVTAAVTVREFVLTLIPDAARLDIPAGTESYTVGLTINADPGQFNFTCEDSSGGQVLSAEPEGQTVRITPLTAGESTITVTAVHKNDPALTASASIRVTVAAQPDIAFSLGEDPVYVPVGGKVIVPLDIAQAGLPQGVSELKITGIAADHAQIRYDGSALTLAAKSAGTDTYVSVSYTYTFTVGGTAYPMEGTRNVPLTVTAFNSTDQVHTSFSGSWWTYTASADLAVLAGMDCTVTGTGGNKKISNWSSKDDVNAKRITASGDSTLTVTISEPKQSGEVTVSGEYKQGWATYGYTLTIDLTVYANPEKLILSFGGQAP